MKAFKLSIFLLVVIIVSSFYYIYIINRTVDSTISKIEELEHMVKKDNWKSAQKQLDEIKEKWEKYEKWMTAVVDQEEMDEINTIFFKLSQCIHSKESPTFMTESAELKLLIQNIAAKEKVNLSNLL